MAWFGLTKDKEPEAPIEAIQEEMPITANMHSTPIFIVSYDGEKTPGEIGDIKSYLLDYNALRARSWQSYLESEITQDVINKFVLWIIGSGLKLQSEPVESIISDEIGTFDLKTFSKKTEDRFKLYANSTDSSYSEMVNLNDLAHEVKKNALIGGDCLVINRLVGVNVQSQIVDGVHVQTPIFGNDFFKAAKAKGNTILNGIEQTKTGKHVAYYVRTSFDKFDRIEAFSSGGQKMAYMVYGLSYRIDGNRGIPIISAVLESLKKIDRYKEATVGSAEERQKIIMSIEHDVTSTGENPFNKVIAQSAGIANNINKKGEVNDDQIIGQIAATYDKQVINMPKGAKLAALNSKNELTFKDFYTTNINLICATIGIPPDIALSKYDSNFSASRAAIKDWEHTIMVNRKKFSRQFYQPFYEFWLDVQIRTGRIPSTGYLQAVISGDSILLSAYRNARWVGANVPHIDPEKEVRAERAKLGEQGAMIPLTTAEAATEALGAGDFEQNQNRFKEELIIADLPKEEDGSENNGAED